MKHSTYTKSSLRVLSCVVHPCIVMYGHKRAFVSQHTVAHASTHSPSSVAHGPHISYYQGTKRFLQSRFSTLRPLPRCQAFLSLSIISHANGCQTPLLSGHDILRLQCVHSFSVTYQIPDCTCSHPPQSRKALFCTALSCISACVRTYVCVRQ